MTNGSNFTFKGKNEANKNTFLLAGQIKKKFYSHEINGIGFWKYLIAVKRLYDSNNVDILPIMVSDKLLFNNAVEIDDFVIVSGQIRTKIKRIRGEKRVLVFGSVKDINKIEEEDLKQVINRNLVELEGYIAKPVVCRETTTSRLISDIILYNNARVNKRNYIPCIAWGADAKMSSNINVENYTKIAITGRFQSRIFNKENDESKFDIAYEISITDLKIVNEELAENA